MSSKNLALKFSQIFSSTLQLYLFSPIGSTEGPSGFLYLFFLQIQRHFTLEVAMAQCPSPAYANDL